MLRDSIQNKLSSNALNKKRNENKEQNAAMISNFIDAHNKIRQSQPHRVSTGVNSGSARSKLTTIMGKKVDLGSMNDGELHQMHDSLINIILTEEEGLISSHRQHVDKMCSFSTAVRVV